MVTSGFPGLEDWDALAKPTNISTTELEEYYPDDGENSTHTVNWGVAF
jgi:hypothetical protein